MKCYKCNRTIEDLVDFYPVDPRGTKNRRWCCSKCLSKDENVQVKAVKTEYHDGIGFVSKTTMSKEELKDMTKNRELFILLKKIESTDIDEREELFDELECSMLGVCHYCIHADLSTAPDAMACNCCEKYSFFAVNGDLMDDLKERGEF